MKTEITAQDAHAALVAKLRIEVAHLGDLLRWGSWTCAAELADSMASTVRAVRRLETEPVARQEVLDFLCGPEQPEFFTATLEEFSRFLHRSVDNKQPAIG